MLETGTKAPAFTLPDQNGTEHSLEDYKGKKVILYFYHFGKSTTPDQLDQTWVNCLNLFDVGYTV